MSAFAYGRICIWSRLNIFVQLANARRFWDVQRICIWHRLTFSVRLANAGDSGAYSFGQNLILLSTLKLESYDNPESPRVQLPISSGNKCWSVADGSEKRNRCVPFQCATETPP